jgi:hypothetical protein
MVGEHGGEDIRIGFWGAVGIANDHQFHRAVADTQRSDRATLGGETNREILHDQLAYRCSIERRCEEQKQDQEG